MNTPAIKQPNPQNRTHSTRLEGFSDAVFAFSATLLVVSLEVPDSFPELINDLRGFVAFGFRFAVLVSLWSVHHAYFRRYQFADSTIVFLNSCLLFVILFYVYPMKFMSQGIIDSITGNTNRVGVSSWDDLALMFMLYSAGFCAIFFFVALMYRHALKNSEKRGFTILEEKQASFFMRHYAILSVVGMVSVIMAALQIGIRIGAPGYVYMILGPLCYLHAKKYGPDKQTSGE